MATGTFYWFTKASSNLANGLIDWEEATVDSGTATGGTSVLDGDGTDTLVDTGNFTIDEHIGRYVIITSGTGAGQAAYITDNDADTLTLTGTGQWAVAPSTDSVYKVVDKVKKVMLVTDSYVMDATNQNADEFLSDITLSNEITNVGGSSNGCYNARNGDASGGYILVNTTISEATNVTTFNASDLSLTTTDQSLGAVKNYVVFQETGTLAGTDCPLIGIGVIDTAQTATAGNTFSIDFSTNGVCKTTAGAFS